MFLYGGNDANNLLVPRSASDYANYAAVRQNLALAQASLLPIHPLETDGRDYGLHPSCTGLQELFETEKMAILCNVGTLVYPLTKAEYEARTVPRPPQLFSHNDQQVQWQTSVPDQLSRTGWGGRCADLVNDLNPGGQVSMSISLAGFNTFEVGNVVQQYQVSTTGSVGLTGLTAAQVQAMRDIIAVPRTNLFEREYGAITERAIQNHELLSAALAGIAEPAGFPATSLGNQLKMIAKLIAARDALSLKRQIFFCSIGGYDTHGEQLTTQAGLLNELSGALKAFADYVESLGISDKVTAFTGSDFNRTFPSNGVGSDHAWGGPSFDHRRRRARPAALRHVSDTGRERPRRHHPGPVDPDHCRGRIRRDIGPLFWRQPDRPDLRAAQPRTVCSHQPWFSAMTQRVGLIVVLLLLLPVALVWYLHDQPPPAPATPAPPLVAEEPAPVEEAPAPPAGESFLTLPVPPPGRDGRIVIAPDRVRAELEEVRFLLRDYRAACGENPVGNNAEIAGALAGGNARRARFLPDDARRNAAGELLDPWGTPYFFHQLSAREMEIRSAGPDRRMWTEDDAVWP